MPIPYFDHNNVTPPHIGSPTDFSQVSPYSSTILEFIKHFATTNARIEILKGLLEFRQKLNELGLIEGFQWLDGSFTENIEVTLERAPNDLDIVTFYNLSILNDYQREYIESNFTEFFDSEESKRNYKLDHYPVNYWMHPLLTVQAVTYWVQLFSHNRSGIWKGIIKIELNTPDLDSQALEFLNSLEL